MNISAVAITNRGIQLSKRLQQKSDGMISSFFCSEADLNAWVEKNFLSLDALILICTIDNAVCAISPYLKAATKVPSVIVIDDAERFAIPIISGTLGIANDIATAISTIADCIPVITTSTDTESVFSIDKWASSVGLQIANPENIKYRTSKLISGEKVHFDSILPITGEPPKGFELSGPTDFSDFTITYQSSVPKKTLHLVPPVLTLGIHCENDASSAEIETAYTEFLKECGCHPLSVRDVCTVDLDKQASGLVDFCSSNKLSLRVFTAEDLSAINSPLAHSEPERACEHCAVLGSGGTLFVRKMQINDISLALAIIEPVEKD